MPKWSQVGTKVEAKTDLNTKMPKSAKVYKTQWNFNDLGVRACSFGNKKHQKTRKNGTDVDMRFFIDFL